MEFDISLEGKNRRSQVSFYILGESGPGSRRYIILQKIKVQRFQNTSCSNLRR